MIKIALANIVQVATSRGLAPYRIAYLWVGQRCWYNPMLYPKLHLQHYRSWMRHRVVFFACALYAPNKNSDERQADEAARDSVPDQFPQQQRGGVWVLRAPQTVRERISRPSVVDGWQGCEAFPRGQGNRRAASGRLGHSPAQGPDRVFERALDPTAIDEDGYSSIPELLE
ncbi:hypothetical protein PR003_g18976 [Phytophthora rubi]|uniref:Uncharacterized protein n=1 Tax=Phytophthora rubi TaxID=129364 RepID=A0A6A3JU02_9STRA|nr:hypothetical protein PR002_g18637 [Phytophthora rubi]KAE9038971.1 hypothetical protein PR001_g7729 [Phytophthora rubi]KAE9315494.1 hypothetical protein PR003_g18976 [Phytophthora rubi]